MVLKLNEKPEYMKKCTAIETAVPPPSPLHTSIGYKHPSKTPYKVAEAQGLKAAVYHMSLGIRPSGPYRWNLSNWVERGTVRVKCLAQEHNTMHMTPARV